MSTVVQESPLRAGAEVLIRLIGSEALRDNHRRGAMAALNVPYVAAHLIDRAGVTLQPQPLEDALRDAPLAHRKLLLRFQPALQDRQVRTQLQPRLTLVHERLSGRAQRPLHRVARDPTPPRNTADRLALHQPPVAEVPDRLHPQHPGSPPRCRPRQLRVRGGHFWMLVTPRTWSLRAGVHLAETVAEAHPDGTRLTDGLAKVPVTSVGIDDRVLVGEVGDVQLRKPRVP